MGAVLQDPCAGADGAVGVDVHDVQLPGAQLLQVGIEGLIHQVHQLAGVGHHIGLHVAIAAAPDIPGGAGHGDEIDAVHIQGLAAAVAQDGLLGEPEQVGDGEVGGDVVGEDLGQLPDPGDVGDLEALLHHGLEEALLGLDPAQIAGVVAVGAVPEADHLHGLVSVQELVAGVHVDEQVLGGVPVVHVPGHVIPHAAQGIHQLPHSLPLHHYLEVGDKAHQLADLISQGLQAVISSAVHVVDRVDTLDVPGDIDHGVPGDAHDVELLVGHVVGRQEEGVGVATAAGVPADDQEGEEILLPAAAIDAGGLAIQLLRGVAAGGELGDVRRDGHCGLDEKEPGHGEGHHDEGGQHRHHDIDHPQGLLFGGELGLWLFGGRGLSACLLEAAAPLVVFLVWGHSCRPFR